jgi:hypothetical protein
MSEDKEEARKFDCNLCGKTFEFCGRCYVGNLGKEGVANDDPLVVDFRGGRFDGNAYLLDPVPMYAKAQTDEHGIRWLAACGDCLEAMVESGEMKRKPLQKCLTCGGEFQDSHGFDGSDVEVGGKTVFGYGSVTADGDIRRVKLPEGWHCYPCLDKEVREGRSEFMKAYMFLNDLRGDQPKDSVETCKQILYQARNDIALTLRSAERMLEEMKARGIKILGDNHGDAIVDNARMLVIMRHRLKATERAITEILGDADKWKDGESAS